jgi:hypothetical protein
MLSQLGHLTLHPHHKVWASSRLEASSALQVSATHILNLQSFKEQVLLSYQPSWLGQCSPYLHIMLWARLLWGR